MAFNFPTLPAVSTPPSQQPSTSFASDADTYFQELKAFSDALAAVVAEMNTVVGTISMLSSVPAYNAGTTYNFPDMVADSNDGYTYMCVGTSVLGVTPSTDDGSSWVRQTEDSVVDSLLEVDCTGLSATSLPCHIHDVFTLTDIDQDIDITVDLENGRTVTIYLIDPGSHVVEFLFPDCYAFWMDGVVVEPTASGVTSVTVTKVATGIVTVSYQAGYSVVI